MQPHLLAIAPLAKCSLCPTFPHVVHAAAERAPHLGIVWAELQRLVAPVYAACVLLLLEGSDGQVGHEGHLEGIGTLNLLVLLKVTRGLNQTQQVRVPVVTQMATAAADGGRTDAWGTARHTSDDTGRRLQAQQNRTEC